MSQEAKIKLLRAEIKKSLSTLNRIEKYILDFQKKKLKQEPGIDEAMIITQALTNYYTCLETIFLRISKFFENTIDNDKWHRSLLEKMALDIEEIRPNVISDSVYEGLLELLKFRHFSRYYFEFDYDWDKIRFVLQKFNEIHITIKDELDEFDRFLVELSSF